ncbi:MAG: uridine kinase [Gemmatimonadota bacterium]
MGAGVRPVVLGVAGGSGSGKSTVVREVGRLLGEGVSTVLHHDAYYRDLAHLTPEERARVNFDHPDSLETGLMAEHVRALQDGLPVRVPTYDFTTHTRTTVTEELHPSVVLILDGILVLADARLRELMDLKVFVDTEADVRLLRRIRRDVVKRGRTADSVIAQYEATVRPMHLEFVEPSKRFADMVVPEGGYNQVAVDLVVSRIRGLLEGREAVVRG